MNKKFILSILFVMIFAFAKAQLGFCNGVAGDIIFNETFGAGISNGPPLPAGVTTYRYVNNGTQDGEYSISRNANQLQDWHISGDHTGDTNGKMLVVNADFNPGLFYRTPVNGLCENTPYEFSAWILNVLRGGNNSCGNREIPIQVRFEIWDATDTILLRSGAMQPKFADPTPTWIQYGLTFTTTSGQNGVILKMINQGIGGCGNDLAIDDIVFRPCGDNTNITTPTGANSIDRCESDPAQSYTLNASASTAIFTTPAYQWQTSTDGVTFTDITGATNATFTTGILNTNIFYRAKVAEDAINLNNSQCVNFSDVWEFDVITVPAPVAVTTDVLSCDMDPAVLEVTVQNGETAAWFTTPTGGTAIATGTSFSATSRGTYYAEAISIMDGCRSSTRTAINFRRAANPIVNNEDFLICPDQTALLDTEFAGGSYLWNTGETVQAITVNSSGTFTCVVTNSEGCESTATFNVSFIALPIIQSLNAIGDELTVTLVTPGNFLFSIDGFNYQRSNVFDIATFLQVTVRVRNADGCAIVREVFSRIAVPAFFTPNGDGFNDRWSVDGITAFPGARVEIYDRYGKLLQQLNTVEAGWDGTFNNQPLPSSDYWYRLYYNNEVITGHFSLKR